ncbi:MAG: phosphopantothenoylcysteine decarboxylase [Planctomycetota bacterium]
MRFLITAGPTREPLDAVRFLSNRSSGAMGVSLANAAASAGAAHDVTLLLGPVDSAVAGLVDAAVTVARFDTAAALEALLSDRFAACDVLVMAAAVADFRAAQTLPGKAKRQGEMVLTLAATPDLVAGCAARKRDDQAVVAFALEEPERLEARAVEKMRRKGVDAIVANPLRTMDAGEIEAMLLTADGRRLAPGAMAKPDFAAWLVEQAAALRG